MDKNLIDLPVGQVFTVAALEGTEHTDMAVVTHDLTVMSYDSPGERFCIVHSSAFPSQLIGVFGAPVPVTSAEYES